MLVFRREVRDVLRDRRTIFVTLVLPVILYPTLMVGFTSLFTSLKASQEERQLDVMVLTPEGPLVRDAGPAPGSLAEAIVGIATFEFRDVPDPVAAVEAGELHLYLELPRGIEARLAERGRVDLAPVHRSTDDDSRTARDLLRQAVEGWRDGELPLFVSAQGDLATPVERGGREFGGIVAMMVVLMALTGAFYPALDLAAGEKERGTLETLLLTPASRRELVLGKYLTVLAVAVAAAAANLASMSFTFSSLAGLAPGGSGTGLEFSLDGRTLVVILVGLVLTAALFSAVTLAISTFARTYKEGQVYLTPVMVLVLPLAMLGMLPGIGLTGGTALIPVANVVLLIKDMLAGGADLLPTLMAFGSLLVLAAAALEGTARLFDREDVLFRESPETLSFRARGRPTREAPTATAALVAVLTALAAQYYATLQLVSATLAAQIIVPMLILGAAAVLFARLSGTSATGGLGLVRTPLRALGAGLVVGCLAALVSWVLGFLQQQVREPGPGLEELNRRLQDFLSAQPLLAVLLMTVVPAFVEELFFRGLVLRGLLKPLGAVGAVVVAALIFAGFHMSPDRFLPQAAAGLIFGWLTVRTRSVVPAMIAHAAHNGLIVALSG